MSQANQLITNKVVELTGPGGMFELESVELNGINLKAFKHAPKTLAEVMNSARGHGDKPFCLYSDEHLSYAEFYEKVDHLAAQFQNRWHIKAGDRIAIAMRNYPEWLIAFTATALCGAIAVPLNSWAKADELIRGLEDSEPSLLVCDQERFALAENWCSNYLNKTIVARPSESFHAKGAILLSTLLSEATPTFTPPATAKPNDICVILYTSGSTGFPKGVCISNIMITQALMNMMFVGALAMMVSDSPMAAPAASPCVYSAVPLFHGTGLLSGFILPFQMGFRLVIAYKWDAETALKIIEAERVTNIVGVPAITRALLTTPNFSDYDTSSVSLCGFGGAAADPELLELLERKLPNSGRATGWGMTETCSAGSSMNNGLYSLSPNSSGYVSPLMEIRTVDENGAVAGSGEVQCRSVCCTPGYWRNEEATKKIYTDGWMHTGDVGHVDEDGFLFITGRIKDIVIRGGENIFPGEIEAASYECPGVDGVCVFGTPDKVMGEELVMVYYSKNGEASESAIRSHLASRFAGYKVPKYIVATNEPLPRNVSEKIDKMAVAKQYEVQTKGKQA